jgi:glucans biosynthesis protein
MFSPTVLKFNSHCDLCGLFLLALCLTTCRPSVGSEGVVHIASFGLQNVCEEAAQLARRDFVPLSTELPAQLQTLNYLQYRAIKYRRDLALWTDESLPYRVEFYHRGYIYPQRVDVAVVDENRIETVPFSPSLFSYGSAHHVVRNLPKSLGFAGFRILHPRPLSNGYDEILSFLGASYFRSAGPYEMNGVSARGLGLGIGSSQEEFPTFRKFWLKKPTPTDASLTLWALLDSPSLTGAYQFVIRPDDETTIEVHAVLFARATITDLGLAPLTSMFYYDQSNDSLRHDDRPEVHDSDGLALWLNEGEQLWRPLRNPSRVSLSAFEAKQTRGFGLLQRNREPDAYLDTGAQYEDRTSMWVEPLQPWDAGEVRLLELPSTHEGEDNITAFWKPSWQLKAGESREIAYRIHVGGYTRPGPDSGLAAGTFWKIVDGTVHVDVTFDLPVSLDATPEPVLTVNGAQAETPRIKPGRSANSWIVSFDAHAAPGTTAECRLFLRHADHTLTETWSMPCQF